LAVSTSQADLGGRRPDALRIMPMKVRATGESVRSRLQAMPIRADGGLLHQGGSRMANLPDFMPWPIWLRWPIEDRP
jgi:hypothetical protein